MGKVSASKKKSVYQLAREELDLTRAEAIDRLPGISESRLVKIENGSVAIQPADVVLMAEGYNKPELRNHYCCYDCEIGKIDAQKTTNTEDVHKLLVDMAVSLKSVNHNKIRLMEILNDEIVEDCEIIDFKQILNDLDHISATIDSLKLWCERKGINTKSR